MRRFGKLAERLAALGHDRPRLLYLNFDPVQQHAIPIRKCQRGSPALPAPADAAIRRVEQLRHRRRGKVP